MRNKRNNFCIHERDSKRKIYVVFSASGGEGGGPRWGSGLCSWTPLGDFKFRPQTPSTLPPNLGD